MSEPHTTPYAEQLPLTAGEEAIDQDTQKDSVLDWHAAFFDAMRAELVEYLDVLEFEREHPLNDQPLRIDALVIKIPPDVVIKKNFAENFRGHNIFEYKSPEDSLGMTEYLKTIGYACLYQDVEKVDYTDITITLVCTMKPEALLAHLRSDTKGRYTVTVKQPGIYVVDGERFPIQILESKLLSPKENAWLASLKKDADRVALERAVELDATVSEKINLGAYWHVVSHANVDIFSEVIKMSYAQAEATLTRVLEEVGHNQKQRAIGRDEGVDITLTIMKGLQKNISPAQLSADTGMPLERVEKIKQEVYG